MDRDYDEEGEPIFDPDREPTPEPEEEENWEQDAGFGAESGDDDEAVASAKPKPRKRLIKKTAREHSPSDDEPSAPEEVAEEEEIEERPKKKQKEKDNRFSKETMKSKSKSGAANKLAKPAKGPRKPERAITSHSSKRGDIEEKEMWASVAGHESEDDNEGTRTGDDDAFIDDTGVEPATQLAYSDDEAGSIGDAPQAEEGEEDDDLKKLFKSGKSRNKKNERSPEEIAMLVEQFMARLEVAAEEDAELNRQSKPAINKLELLPSLLNVLSKRQLQQEFLDRGVLSVLKNWLEPLPDGSLPNMTIRSALLKLLTELPIDVELDERREQLKKSGLGKVIMFLSKSDEEGSANRKLARDLVDKWSRPIFQKSTRYEDLRKYDDERPPPPRPSVKKPAMKAAARFDARGDDLDMIESSLDPKPGEPGYRLHASRPEALPLDFVVRPLSKVDPEEIRHRAKQQRMDERRMKMNKKLQQLKAPKKKRLQASKSFHSGELSNVKLRVLAKKQQIWMDEHCYPVQGSYYC
ncbi:hypothetical protein L7F22_060805 [Adiantum nelumboides]|nr:hypothetical protein [Adiantum nelumboides]